MIKALLLMFSPAETWERIVTAKHRMGFVLIAFLLPLLLLTSLAEGLGLVHWGKPRGVTEIAMPFSVREAVSFELTQDALSIVVVLVGAIMVKSLGETFHGRHTYQQALTTVVYGISPILLLRAFNAFPGVSPWITWAIGVAFTFAILYHGVPRVMEPDPPHAFGLFLMSVLLLAIVTGLACFLSVSYMQGKFTRLNALFSFFSGQ